MFHFTILLVCVLAPLAISKPVTVTPIACGPVCDIYCEYGNVPSDEGCPTCSCNESPCENEQAPLNGYSCGSNQTDCPSTYECVIGPNNAYAVCCPSSEEPTTNSMKTSDKPGSCPPPPSPGTAGPCMATCTNDSDCEGNLKCCGDCPRECVEPVS